MKFHCKVTHDFALIPVDDEGIKYLYNRNEGDVLSCDIKQEVGKRTIKQNKSLHKYLTIIAEKLAESGQDMREVVRLPITPTVDNVKEEMWKPVMSALYPDKTSTTELSTKEMTQCYEVFNSAVGERLGVSADWPSIDSMMNESMGIK